MKNIIITGSNGMIGGLILQECLNRPDVAKVTSIVRGKSGIAHAKLVEIIHENFLDYSSIAEHFKNQDAAFYCIGVYTGQLPKDEFRKITVDFTKAFAKTLRENSAKATFCFLSGQGADQKEKS
ncbi:MAG: NAD(P)H-binding protein, partial [Bacteroidota bacterium]|nr:NAD(P)H-binding protein [Bacteroidota bacterium]